MRMYTKEFSARGKQVLGFSWDAGSVNRRGTCKRRLCEKQKSPG